MNCQTFHALQYVDLISEKIKKWSPDVNYEFSDGADFIVPMRWMSQLFLNIYVLSVLTNAVIPSNAEKNLDSI